MTIETWKRYTEWPFMGLSVLFLVVYSIQVINNIPDSEGTHITVILQLIWLLFGVDYITQLILAENKKTWFFRNIPQLFMLALPALRPLRILRLLSLLKFIELLALRLLQGKIVVYVITTACLLTYMGAIAVLDAEQNNLSSNIKTFGDALWWAVATITTVGYGDYYPVTISGRFVAVGLMISGIAVLGVITATLASWIVEKVRATTVEATEELETDLTTKIDSILQKVASLEKQTPKTDPLQRD